AWRKNVGPLGQDVRQLLAKKPESLPDHDAAFQKKATNLLDHRGSLTDEARPHPMQRLQIQLLVGFGGHEAGPPPLDRLGHALRVLAAVIVAPPERRFIPWPY